MSRVPPTLLEAYRRDVIDTETFERLVADAVAGRVVMWPAEVVAIGLELREGVQREAQRRHARDLRRLVKRLLSHH